MSRFRQALRNNPPPPALWRGCGFLLNAVIQQWMSSLHYRVAYYDKSADPAAEQFVGPNIYLFWHEYIPSPLYLRAHSRLAILVSQHQDAELLTHAAHFAGLETIRGSSGRGGIAALKTILTKGKGLSLAITPDGPRGPRRVLAPGCIFLSSRLQIPIVPVGYGYDRPWRYRRVWDQFAIPRPFSKARAVSGPRIQIPPDVDKATLESYRVWVEAILNQLTDKAEQWAEGKIQLAADCPLYPSPARVTSQHGCTVPQIPFSDGN